MSKKQEFDAYVPIDNKSHGTYKIIVVVAANRYFARKMAINEAKKLLQPGEMILKKGVRVFQAHISPWRKQK